MRMKIGEAARQAGCKVVTIRYYEQERLLPAPERSGGNYRLYSEEDIERLKFIRHCRKHDMRLDEIRKLLAYRDAPDQDCVWVSELLDAHVSNVDAQIESLLHLKSYLQDLRKRCSGGGSAATCGIMQGLNDIESCGCEQEEQLRAGG